MLDVRHDVDKVGCYKECRAGGLVAWCLRFACSCLVDGPSGYRVVPKVLGVVT